MLFQNSCVVPFGITAMVNFLLAVGASALVQLTAATASNISREQSNSLRIIDFPTSSFPAKAQRRKEKPWRLCAFAPLRETNLSPQQSLGFLNLPCLEYKFPSGRPA